MKTVFKYIFLATLVLSMNGIQAQPEHAPLPSYDSVAADLPEALEMESVMMCYMPAYDAVAIIDSVECAVHILVRDGDSMRCCAVYVTDDLFRRYDLTRIVRPVSLSVLNDHLVLLASSKNDSSYLAFLPFNIDGCRDTMKADVIVGFQTNANAFRILSDRNEILVIGRNPVGYDMAYVQYDDSMMDASIVSKSHYHVMRQAERIANADPSGVLLTLVAVIVVFLLLTCICFIMKGFAASVLKVQTRKSHKSAERSGIPADEEVNPGQQSGEVFAAIAAAIYAYNEDLHDEENTVITIQKVERAWTPWNAKFYNMNRYFNNRR